MSPASRPKRGNALFRPTSNPTEAHVPSPPLSSSADAAAKDVPLLFDRFHPADPDAKSLYPLPPNRRPDFELFGPDELMVMVNCQLEVYTEKHATIEQRCLGLRALHRGGPPWTNADLKEYGVLKSYRELLHEKKTFWENLYNEGISPSFRSLPQHL